MGKARRVTKPKGPEVRDADVGTDEGATVVGASDDATIATDGDALDLSTIVALSVQATTSMVPPPTPEGGPQLPRGTLVSGQVSGSSAPPQKYAVVGSIGHGGGGDVFEVRDQDLRRSVALKRLRREHDSPAMLQLFLQEAQLTAQLEHPNIVPVHEMGATARGEPFFTMKRVWGQTLQDVLRGLSRRDPDVVARFTGTRLLIIFLEVVRGVAHAHARGVVHRDLKPANVLIGVHGETLVADWGLAVPDRLPPETAYGALPPVEWPSARIDELGISGTLQAMPPEQARGEPLDRRADVYALGVILYEMLTGERPFSWKSPREAALSSSLPEAPRGRSPHREISEELQAICLRCLEPDKARRYAGAGELAVVVESALTGSRRRQVAMLIEGEARLSLQRMRELQAERERLRAKLAELSAVVKPWDGEVQKRPLWEAEERLFDVDIAIDDALDITLDRLTQSVGQDPSYTAAEDLLADLHLELFIDAERRGHRRDQHFHRRLVERHHRGRHEAILAGRGLVTLRVKKGDLDAADYSVTCTALVERGKRIVAADDVPLPEPERGGRVQNLSLPKGSYLFAVRPRSDSTDDDAADTADVDDGFAPTTVHVQVGRQANIELTVTLPKTSSLVDGFVHIPAGPFIAGGDAESQNAGPRRDVELPDFFIARSPVTCSEYLDFLNAMAATDKGAAARHVPRTKPDGGALWEAGADGRYALPRYDADGNPVLADAPVMGVSFFDAQAYCAWRSAETGIAYRLPSEDEWEKAARGVDGRFFPWGNGFDSTFCKMATSRPGRPQPEPVRSYPVDRSVYGVFDCAGGIREWCNDFYDDAKETRSLRGGAWYFNPSFCRVAFRHGYLPHIVFTNFGFRLAKSA